MTTANEHTVTLVVDASQVKEAVSDFNGDTGVAVMKLDPRATIPAYATDGSAGLDLSACLPEGKPGYEALEVRPGQRVLVPTKIAIALQPGFEAQVRPRSGLALKHGVTVLNSPGTVDSDYRGEVFVMLHNTSDKPFYVNHGDRIGQMVIARYARANLTEVASLDDTARGAGGFGSTGV